MVLPQKMYVKKKTPAYAISKGPLPNGCCWPGHLSKLKQQIVHLIWQYQCALDSETIYKTFLQYVTAVYNFMAFLWQQHQNMVEFLL